MLEMLLSNKPSGAPYPPGLIKSHTLAPAHFNYNIKATFTSANGQLVLFDSVNNLSMSDFYTSYFNSGDQVDFTWASRKWLNRSIFDAGIAVKDRLPVVVGGQITNQNQSAVYRYTPSTDTWANLANLPTGGAKCYAQSNDIGLLVCVDAITQGRIFKMDHAGTTWTQFGAGFNTGVSMSRPSLGAWADKFCLVGGQNNNRCFIFNADGTGTPTEIASLPVPLLQRASNVAYYKNKLYILGGTTNSSETLGDYLSTMWVYDFDTNTWGSFEMPMKPVFKASLVVANDRLIILGGRISSASNIPFPDTPNREIFIYNA